MSQKISKSIILIFLAFSFFTACTQKKSDTNTQNELAIAERWSVEKANAWGDNHPWFRGSNFNPSTSINQLEFWQAETFDPETIDRELGWAEDIGFNAMRVYLHHVAWEVDKAGFKERMKSYLTIADKHHVKTIFVFFDDCWNPTYTAGKQPEPKTGVHNSGWVRDPGDLLFTAENLTPTLEAYTKDILETFKDDQRIILWDLYNEPGNSNYGNKSMGLLKDVFKWGREINPSQPLTSGVWNNSLSDLNKFQVENSDIITYHNYNDEINHQSTIDSLKLHNRPMICTEYMARKHNSLFSNIMPILKEQKIGAINWGLVAGKSNTKYAWDDPIPDGSEPEPWFHEIFQQDGTPYKQEEVDVIKELTFKK
jgi:hypothetical protein